MIMTAFWEHWLKLHYGNVCVCVLMWSQSQDWCDCDVNVFTETDYIQKYLDVKGYI